MKKKMSTQKYKKNKDIILEEKENKQKVFKKIFFFPLNPNHEISFNKNNQKNKHISFSLNNLNASFFSSLIQKIKTKQNKFTTFKKINMVI